MFYKQLIINNADNNKLSKLNSNYLSKSIIYNFFSKLSSS